MAEVACEIDRLFAPTLRLRGDPPSSVTHTIRPDRERMRAGSG
jgi:hypothetical protein